MNSLKSPVSITNVSDNSNINNEMNSTNNPANKMTLSKLYNK